MAAAIAARPAGSRRSSSTSPAPERRPLRRGATRVAYDVVVLDVMLPEIDGFEICRRLRETGVWVPVIMLTARDAVDDRVRGPRRRAPTTT